MGIKYTVDENGTVLTSRTVSRRYTVKGGKSSPPQKSPSERDMRPCPFCNSQVREDRLQKHIQSKCPKQQRVHPQHTEKTRTKQRAASQAATLVPCPHCPSKVRKDNLQNHIKKVHVDKFDRRGVNRRLKQYATGNDEWQWS